MCSIATYLITTKIIISGGTFILLMCLQLLLGRLYNSYLIRVQEIHNQKIKRLSNMSDLQLTCAYCTKPSNVTLDLTQDNTYICPKCKCTNKIIVQYYTARITVPLVEKIDASPIIDETPTIGGIDE
jgi:hypothetical protein